jgi:hypothetical protein
MERNLTVFILGGMALLSLQAARGQSALMAPPATTRNTSAQQANSIDLPPAPQGKSTVFGGEIRSIDPVRDELTLKVYGQKPMKILFDERTLVFLDGKRIALRTLGPEQHAAVETTLDGVQVFAVSIHALSQPPEGDYQGRVVNYDPGTGELTIVSSGAREPFKVLVAKDTAFRREGQTNFTSAGSGPGDLRKGSLITVDFQSGQQGRGVASKISVLAVPGTAFSFNGNITLLNLSSGSMELVDPRDEKSYQISFDPARIPAGKDLHLGEHVSVEAEYDGLHYMANQITPE